MLPQKVIGRYVISTTNSILSYLIMQNVDFKVEVFNSIDEKEESIISTLNDIRDKDFYYVIAPVTINGANFLAQHGYGLKIFIPTIHKDDIQYNVEDIVYGGIDYKEQILKLKQFNSYKKVVFKDSSQVGRKLTNIIQNEIGKIDKIVEVKNKTKMRKIIRRNNTINKASVYLNTPLIKTSLLMSQFTYHSKRPKYLLSTQINYNPLILTLTQHRDRKKMVIANSITNVDDKLIEMNKFLDNDILYNWINYSSSFAIDYFYNDITNNNRLFNQEVINNQVQYKTVLYKPARNKLELLNK